MERDLRCKASWRASRRLAALGELKFSYRCDVTKLMSLKVAAYERRNEILLARGNTQFDAINLED